MNRMIHNNTVHLGNLTARWTEQNRLVLTSATCQHIAQPEEVLRLLELLYQNKEALFAMVHPEQMPPSLPQQLKDKHDKN